MHEKREGKNGGKQKRGITNKRGKEKKAKPGEDEKGGGEVKETIATRGTKAETIEKNNYLLLILPIDVRYTFMY